jgi:hypothetical protein
VLGVSSVAGVSRTLTRMHTSLNPVVLVALALISSLALNACSSAQVAEPTAEPRATAPAPARTQIDEEPIDVLGLQRSLSMERDAEDLGFQEKGFDTCQAGYGFSASQNCRRKSFVVLHFKLECRDSEGTVSNADYQLTPVVSDNVKWNFGGRAEGITLTDTAGIGQIRYIAPSPVANQKLRLTVNGKFLILTASEAKRMVVPDSWCRTR